MNQYPQEYYNYPTEYQPMLWETVFTGFIGIAILIAVGAWAFSLVKKAFRGEEVEFPL